MKRLALLFVIGLSVAVTPAAAQEGGSGGKNVVLVSNTTDSRTTGRAGIALGRSTAPTSVPENLASARSSCKDCRTVAVAMQAVLIFNEPDVATPNNAAVAVNAGCTRCATMAYAWQYVVSTDGPVTLTTEGNTTLSEIRAEASRLANSDLPFPELEARLDDLAAQMRAVVDEETREVGSRARAARTVRVDNPTC